MPLRLSVSKNKQTIRFLVGATIGRPKSTDYFKLISTNITLLFVI